MILSWKNILWFQTVSEHVLELGHYEIKESEVCITHSNCVKKNILVHFIIQMLMKVYLCWFFLPIDSVTHSLLTSHPALCLLKEKQKKGWGGFCDLFEGISQWGVCDVFSEESAHQPTVWPVVIKYTEFLCLLSIFSVLELQVGLFVSNSKEQSGQRTLGGRIQHLTLKLN